MRAGIHVISTLNIQHLESLYPPGRKRATGVKVKEPESPTTSLSMADQLINADLSAEGPAGSTCGGKAFTLPSVSSVHWKVSFTQANLTRLREFALEEIAHRLDQRLTTTNTVGTNGSAGRIMVCLSSRGPNVDHLVRKTAIALRIGLKARFLVRSLYSDSEGRRHPRSRRRPSADQ